jgi:VCBS repeat-containing protein
LNYAGKFEAELPADHLGAVSPQPSGQSHVERVASPHAPSDAIVVPDPHLLFTGDFKRSGVDLILSRDDHEFVVHDYFRGEKRAALASPDGAHLTGDVVSALTGHVEYSQAGTSVSTGKVIGHVTKLAGTATATRNGVSIILQQGDNVEKGDVVQAGSDSTLGLTFIDGTVFGLSSNARMVLNEMVYDPNGSNNSSLLSLVAGTITFVAGETAKHGDMKVDTPVATMGIRGTAVLVEIDFDIPVLQPNAPAPLPNAKFQVLVEPDGTTGSYILYDKATLTPIATVNKAGQQINISQGTVSVTDTALPPDVQKLITDVFSLKFTSDTNTKTFDHFSDVGIPQSLQPIVLANGATAIPVIVNVSPPPAPPPSNAGGPTDSSHHIPGPPSIAAFGGAFTERAGITGSSQLDTVSNKVIFADINAGDLPTVSTQFDSFKYENAQHKDVTATLTGQQLTDIKAVEVSLALSPDPHNNNNGFATWTYAIADKAFDFLAAGETLTLTYVARVDNNFAPSNETAFQNFTITIAGTNDVPVITTGPQHISFIGGTTTVGGPLVSNDPTSGNLSFSDVDLTDTHQVKTELTGSVVRDAQGNLIAGFTIPPTPLAAFKAALTASIASDSTGTGTGTVNWKLADLPAFLADFIPAGDTVTLTYTVTVTDSQQATSTQNVSVTITGNTAPAQVWIATTEAGSSDWNTGTNWETGLAPTANDDAVIITDQLVGKTPLYPVTINAAAFAKSLVLNDFGTKAPELDNNSTLTVGGEFDLLADSIVNNTGTISVGSALEVENASKVTNSGTITLANGGDFKDQSSVTNSGLIEVNVGGTLELENSSHLTNSGKIKLANGGDFKDHSSVTNSGLIEIGGGTLNVLVHVANADGQITVDAPAKLTLHNATIDGGTVGGPGAIDVIGNTKIDGTSASRAALSAGTVTVETNAKLTLDNVTVSGTTITVGGNIELDHNVTLTGGAALKGVSSTAKAAITNLGTLEVAGTATLLDTTLTNDNHSAQIDVGQKLNLTDSTINGGTLTILGELDSHGANFITGATITNTNNIVVVDGTLTIDPTPVNNTGTIVVDHGATLVLDGEIITNAGNGQIQVDGALDLKDSTIDGGVLTISGVLESSGNSFVNAALAGNVEIKGAAWLELGSASQRAYDAAVITFGSSSRGTLELDHAVTFNGTVVGLEDDDTLDLADISFAGATVTYAGDASGGILTVTDGTNIAHINLSGDYTGAGWFLRADASGGTDVVEMAFTSPASISGIAREGEILTAVNGAVNDSEANIAYQWEILTDKGWQSINPNRGSGQTYTPVFADEGHLLRVIEYATDPVTGNHAISTSAATAPVGEALLLPTIAARKNPKGSGTANFTVKFTEAVTGVTADNFQLFNNGGTTSGESIISIDPNKSGTSYSVTVTYDSSHKGQSLGLNFVNTGNAVHETKDVSNLAVATDITDPQFLSLKPAGTAGQPINLALSDHSISGDVDFTITGVAADWTFNAGVKNADGSWAVHTNELAGLTVTPPANFVGATVLEVNETWTNADGTTGQALVADNIEAYAPGSPIFALAGDDHLTATASNDLFVFAQPVGHDVIYSFDAQSDKIDLIGFGATTFGDIHIADDADGNAVITLGANETITLEGVHTASLTAGDFEFDQTPVSQNTGTMAIGDGAILPLSGVINNTGSIELQAADDETDLQLVGTGITLEGGGRVVLSDNAENVISGTSPDATLTNIDNIISGAGKLGDGQLILVNHGEIDATGANALTIDSGSNAVINSGKLEALGSGGLVIHSDLVNEGMLWANDGNITVDGNVTGHGSAVISGSSMIEFAGASTANTAFASGATGTLMLDHGFDFSGVVSGFAEGDHLDLADFNFTQGLGLNYKANSDGAGGTLVVSDGAHVAQIALAGRYDAADFYQEPDHGSGVSIGYHVQNGFHLA